MVYHLIVGDEAAKPLLAAFPEETVVVLRDILNVGPLQKADGQAFSHLRTQWWQQAGQPEKQPAAVNDLEQLLVAATALNNNETAEIWIWMGQLPADVCAYYWALHYLKKHAGRIRLVGLAGLPFLDADNTVFFPKSFAEGSAREIQKCRSLARTITRSEWETDGDEWEKITAENAGIRLLTGSKNISGRSTDYYDDLLEKACSSGFQKAGRVVAQAMKQQATYTGDSFLRWRLREMAAAGLLEMREDGSKHPQDFAVALCGAKQENTEEQTAVAHA